MRKTLALVVWSAFTAMTVFQVAEATAQAAPDPAAVVTLVDVQSVLGGTFAMRVIEPGIVFYEEVGGPRVVEISIALANGKTVSEIKQSRVQDQEPVEDIANLGDAAMYRPQANSATVEKATKAGAVLWFEVRVHNVEGTTRVADTKRLAIELARRGTATLV